MESMDIKLLVTSNVITLLPAALQCCHLSKGCLNYFRLEFWPISGPYSSLCGPHIEGPFRSHLKGPVGPHLEELKWSINIDS